MPAWWRGKSKSAPKSKSTAADDPAAGHRRGRLGKKSDNRKADSFDGVLPPSKSRDPSPSPTAASFAFGHPLPRPSLSLPSLPSDQAAGTASTSSGSSSASSDDTPDLGFHRHSEPINMPSGGGIQTHDWQRQPHTADDRHSPAADRSRWPDISNSPRKEFQLYMSDPSPSGNAYGNTTAEAMFNPKMTSLSPNSRGHPLPMSPTRQRAFSVCPGSPTRRQDDMRNLPHPLPLPPSSPGSSSSRPPQSQWKKGKLLGRGTFGHVYLGFNSDSGQMAAIKEVRNFSDDSNSKESLKQLNQEITLLSQLSHPNIVQYYGSELDEDTLSVYLEYVSGGSIHKLLQEYGPFREPVIRSYTAQILSGLAYLHGRDTVHRDIKGANILVDPTGEVKLADFGMAKHISAYTSIRSFKGSPYWMAPEVIMNSSGYNLSVDIWSLGCTILEMATSKPPWSKFEGVAAIFKIGNSKDIPEIPDYISPDGKAFLKLCLQRDPSARPTASQLMNHPFVRDQATIKAGKINMIRDVLPSSDGSHTLITGDSYSNRSVSPLRDRGVRQVTGFPTSYKSPSGLTSIRMNMSLPVSPCSSPLRQFKQSNRSCLPSPPHPAFSAGAINYSPSNYMLYPMRPNNNFQDPWPDLAPLRISSPYDSPRR